MDIIWIATFYLILTAILVFEAYDRIVGGWRMLFISLLLTPLIGLIVLLMSKKKLNFRHFVKLQNGNVKDKSVLKTLHHSGNDQWVEIKSSELKPV